MGEEAVPHLTETASALTASTTADSALAKAKIDRSDAYAAAHPKYIAFKRVVRDALGRSSKQYQRIHLRSRRGARLEAEEEVSPQPGEEPGKAVPSGGRQPG